MEENILREYPLKRYEKEKREKRSEFDINGVCVCILRKGHMLKHNPSPQIALVDEKQ